MRISLRQEGKLAEDIDDSCKLINGLTDLLSFSLGDEIFRTQPIKIGSKHMGRQILSPFGARTVSSLIDEHFPTHLALNLLKNFFSHRL